jgi:hypothetical protein
MKKLGLVGILFWGMACAATPPLASPPAPEGAVLPRSSTPPGGSYEPPADASPEAPQGDESSALPGPPEGPRLAPAERPIVETDGPYVVERNGDRTCIGLPGHTPTLCGSRVRGPRTKLELVDVHGSLDRAAVWGALANVPSASKGCWDRGPDEVVEARVLVGPQGNVQSAGALHGGDVAACVLPLLNAARFPRAKEGTRVSARLIRMP